MQDPLDDVGAASTCAHGVPRRLERVDEPFVSNDIALTKPEDVQFVAQLVQQVTQWLQASDLAKTSCSLPEQMPRILPWCMAPSHLQSWASDFAGSMLIHSWGGSAGWCRAASAACSWRR
jgi:hypothetical protein